MSSNFAAVNDLAHARSLPIKLRNIIERPRTGQFHAFSRLAELISSNFNAKPANKQNRPEPKTTFTIKESKNARIISVKQPSVQREKSSQFEQQCFTQFFDYFASGREEEKFRPYREQESYQPKERKPHTSAKTRKKAATVNKKASKQKREGTSVFGQWQIEQQQSISSVMFRHNNKE